MHSTGGGRAVNENHPKLRFIWSVSQNTTISIESMIRWVPETVGLAVSLPEGLGFISFRPPPPCGMLALWNSAMRTSYGGFHRAGLFNWGQRQREKHSPLRSLRLCGEHIFCLHHMMQVAAINRVKITPHLKITPA